MKQINRLRAIHICSEYVDGECSTNATEIIHRFLKNIPSIIEKLTCKSKGCRSKTADIFWPMLDLNEIEFDGNMEHLERALIEHFPAVNLCQKCRQPCDKVVRTGGDHLMIKVTLQIITQYRIMNLYTFF